MPISYQWNFNIQRELPGDFLLQVGYVGNKGDQMQIRYDANQAVELNPANPLSINDRRPITAWASSMCTTARKACPVTTLSMCAWSAGSRKVSR